MDFKKEIESIYNSWIGGFISPSYAMSRIGETIKQQKNTVNFTDGVLYKEGIVAGVINGSMVIEKI